MQDPSGNELYNWSEKGYFGVRSSFFEQGYIAFFGLYTSMIYLCILGHTHHYKGYADLSLAEISRITGITGKNCIRHSIQHLQQCRFISCDVKQGRKTRFYPLHWSLWKQRVKKITLKKRPAKLRKPKPIQEALSIQCNPPLSEQERRNMLLQQGEQLKRGQLYLQDTQL
jgi:hypothetical protein